VKISDLLIRAQHSVLVVIGMKERLFPATIAPARTCRNGRHLLVAAVKTGVPALLTDQYPKELGNTVSEIKEMLPPIR